jgi:hypothetical protein
MKRFFLLGLMGVFACACGDDSSSDIGQKGTGGSGGGSAGAATGGAAGTASGGASGSASGGTAGTASGGTAGTATGGTAGASGSPGTIPENCQSHPDDQSQCAGKPPKLYGCINGATYEMPDGCVNIYIGNATDYWCCP